MDVLGNIEPFYRLGLSLAIGLMIGAERGWHTRDLSGGLRTAGVRTFALVGLLGGVWGLLGELVGDLVIGIAFLGIAALAIASHVMSLRQRNEDYGITTLVAFMLTFALGALATRGSMVLAAAAAVIATALLQVKPELHRWIAALDRLELNSAIRLLLISVVVLPLLPNRGFGPGDLLNPFTLWWMVVLVSGISFAGYFALRSAGPRLGPIMTGVVGGLASSTAVTVSFSRLGRQMTDAGPALAAGIAVASAVMFVRVLIIVAIVRTPLVQHLAVPLALMAVTALAGALILSVRGSGHAVPMDVTIRDPAEIAMAVIFGLFLLALTLATYYLRLWLDDRGLYAIGIVAGLVDVDAITLTLSRMAHGGPDYDAAALGVMAAVFSNTVVKAGITLAIAGGTLALRVMVVFGAVLASGAIALVLF